MKKHAHLHQLSVEELEKRIQEATLTLRRLRFAHAVSKLENPMQLRNTKREIARLKTILTAKKKQATTQK
ncbi:MAG: 50S ribosomal protein L29 [Cytophagales bacterium]|nr:50S ribosomal protein L29 [Bernardetiaceae bacterium]MDW8209916.1 50S ribosomal protein L29 [Cytophagales bacterium]